MSLEARYLEAFETHSPQGIREALAAGASATEPIKGKSPVEILIEGYLRSPRFAACLQILLAAGATIEDPVLEAVLLDDEGRLKEALQLAGGPRSPGISVPCAFTSCEGVTPLHICAEFNSVRCARVLLDAGAPVDATAEVDRDGFGGQTPLFHTVNSIFNFCRPMMELLVDAGASLEVRLKGVRWGTGFDWETLILDATPISYAQCGLFAQFHRREEDVYDNLEYLYRRRYGSGLHAPNVPNRYLTPTR